MCIWLLASPYIKHFRGELQHVGHVGVQKIKCRPIRTREIGGVRLQDELYVTIAAIRLVETCVSTKIPYNTSE